MHTLFHFYRTTRMHSADYAVARCLSVRLSDCLSVTRRYVDTAEHILKFLLAPGGPTILVFSCQTGWQYSDENPFSLTECKMV